MRRKDREVTEMHEIEEIIRACKVCQLAMVEEGQPYLVPLNFGYQFQDGVLTLYFHSAKDGRKIDILKKHPRVCFELMQEGKLIYAENPCNFGYEYSSVIGFGDVEFVEEPAEKCEALTLLMRHQVNQEFTFTEAQAAAVCVYKIITSDFTGKRKQNS